MKKNLVFKVGISIIIFLIAGLIIKLVINNTHKQVIVLNLNNSGETIKTVKGQLITVTLTNPGDGGYQFDPPQFDELILQLQDHIHVPPLANANPGDFGYDIFEFKALKTGQSKMVITISRPWESKNPQSVFTSNVIVKEIYDFWSGINKQCASNGISPTYFNESTGKVNYNGKQCCPGLKEIDAKTPQSERDKGICILSTGGSGICRPCGDGICEIEYEDRCNCREDCK